MVNYLWKKYNCVLTPTWGARQKATTATRTYSTELKAAYTSSDGKDHPVINSSGQFTFEDGGSEAISTTNWSGRYWIADINSIKQNTTTSSTSKYYAVITSCSSGLISIKAKATIYESYQTGSTYSQGSLIGNVVSTARSAYPDNGRDESDGFWYVFMGEVSVGKLTVSYNGTTLFTLENQVDDIPIEYNSRTITTLSPGSSRTLPCVGKVMATDVKVGGKTLSCLGKLMASDISISYTT